MKDIHARGATKKANIIYTYTYTQLLCDYIYTVSEYGIYLQTKDHHS